MKVEHHLHACLPDLAAQADNIVEILANALTFMVLRRILWVDEQAHSDGIPALLSEESQQFHLTAIEILIHCALLFVAW
jgi:hypothetical protein